MDCPSSARAKNGLMLTCKPICVLRACVSSCWAVSSWKGLAVPRAGQLPGPHIAPLTFSFHLDDWVAPCPFLHQLFLLRCLSCWHSGLSRKAVSCTVLGDTIHDCTGRSVWLGRRWRGLPGNSQSATSAVPYWQWLAGERTLVRCQSKAKSSSSLSMYKCPCRSRTWAANSQVMAWLGLPTL